MLKAPLPDLPKSKLYFFSQKQAGNFRGQFLPNTEWSLLSPEDEKSDFRLSIEGKTKARLSPLDTEVGEKLYLSDDQGKRSCQLMLTHNSMGAYLNGIRDLRERIKRANEKSDRKQSLPKLLKLEARNGRVVGVPIGTKGIAFTLFETAGSPKFTEERYVAAEEFERVCDTLLRYGQNVEGWLIDKGVHNSALLLKHTFDTDEFTLVLPLMISTNADRAAISKPFDAEPVGA